MANKPYLFYPALVVTAVIALALAERVGTASQEAPGWRRAPSFCSRSRFPSPMRLYRSSTGMPLAGSLHSPPTPIAPRTRTRPPSPCGGSTISTNGSATTASAKRSRRRTLRRSCPSCWFRELGPHVRHDDPHQFRRLSRPGNRARKGQPISHRSRSVSRRHSGRLCVTAKSRGQNSCRGSSTGAACSRPVEVVNAGTEAYTLEDNLERMRRDILPLNPDLILSTHGMNGLLALGLRRGGAKRAGSPAARLRASRPRHTGVRARAA